MSDVDLWVDSDGPEPESIQPPSDARPDAPSMTPEKAEAMARQFFERLDARRARRGGPKGAAASAAGAVAAVSPLARADRERQAVDYGITRPSPTFDERAFAAPPASPLVASPPASPLVPSPPVNAEKASSPKGDPLEPLKITMPAVPISAEVREQSGRLPFKPLTAVNELARTMKVREYNPKQGQTMAIGGDSVEKPVAVLPFVGADVGAGVVPFPRLSLEQYASLCAELALWPARSDEILLRYHVMNEAARRALSEHWQAELALGSEAHAMFVKAVADHAARLRAQGA